MAALNTGIILHRLTLSPRITLKVSPGKMKRERGGRGEERKRLGGMMEGGALKGRYNDHTLLSHSLSPLSAPYSPASASPAFPFLFFHSVPDVSPPSLPFLPAFVLSVCHASAE